MGKVKEKVDLALLKMFPGICRPDDHGSDEHLPNDQGDTHHLFKMVGIQFLQPFGMMFIVLVEDGAFLAQMSPTIPSEGTENSRPINVSGNRWTIEMA